MPELPRAERETQHFLMQVLRHAAPRTARATVGHHKTPCVTQTPRAGRTNQQRSGSCLAAGNRQFSRKRQCCIPMQVREAPARTLCSGRMGDTVMFRALLTWHAIGTRVASPPSRARRTCGVVVRIKFRVGVGGV